MEETALAAAGTCERLWREHADRLLLYATALLRDRASAEDVLQAVFVRLLQGAARPAPDSEGAYLFRAVRNEALNAARNRRRAVPTPLFEAADPAREAERADWSRRVEAALSALSEEEREAVVLKLWSDLSFPQAADVAGVSEKTLEHRYYRGLAALKETLKDE